MALAAIAAGLLGAGPARAGDEATPGFEAAAPAEASGTSLEASVAVLNRYVFRGFRYGGANGVVQPSLEASRAGFTAGLWANLDLRQEATPSFEPDRPGDSALNEVDLSLGWERTFGPVAVGAGWSWYRTWYAEPTQEVLLAVSLEVPGAPALTVFRDVAAYPATYASLALSHAVPLGARAALELGAAFGWLAGDSEPYRTRAADGAPGPMYRALHDGAVEAAVALAAGPLSVRPSVALTFPLSDAARRPDHDPMGPLGTTLVFGVAVGGGMER